MNDQLFSINTIGPNRKKKLLVQSSLVDPTEGKKWLLVNTDWRLQVRIKVHCLSSTNWKYSARWWLVKITVRTPFAGRHAKVRSKWCKSNYQRLMYATLLKSKAVISVLSVLFWIHIKKRRMQRVLICIQIKLSNQGYLWDTSLKR